MAIFCTNCGFKIEDDSLFCPECGQKLLKETSPNDLCEPPVELVGDSAVLQEASSNVFDNGSLEENISAEVTNPEDQSSIEKTEEKEPAKGFPRLWGIIGIALFCILGGIGYASWFMWVLVGLLVLLVIAGTPETRWWQIGLSLVIIIFGTPLFSGSTSSSESAEKAQTTQVENRSNSNNNTNEKSDGLTKKDKEKMRKWLYGY